MALASVNAQDSREKKKSSLENVATLIGLGVGLGNLVLGAKEAFGKPGAAPTGTAPEGLGTPVEGQAPNQMPFAQALNVSRNKPLETDAFGNPRVGYFSNGGR